MKIQRKRLIGFAAGALIFLGVVLVAAIYIPSDEKLARMASSKLSQTLGVTATVGAVSWHLLPVPVILVDEVSIAQPDPITVKHLALYPKLGALWRKSIQFERAELDGANVPQKSFGGIDVGGPTDKGQDAARRGLHLDELPLKRFVFKNITWISRTNVAVLYEGEVNFDPAWRPRSAQMRRPGAATAADIGLTRLGQEDRWTTKINVGGGTANGELQLASRSSGRMGLSGKLQVRNVEVASALQAFNRRSLLSGKAQGEATLSAQGETAADLARSLQTQTPFSMGKSTLLRFDLDKAIRTIGKDHSGQTDLDTVTGLLATQNTAEGMVIDFKGIKVKSGSLSAAGDARLFNRVIDAEFAVDLVDGVVGVPLKVTGPLSKVTVSVPASAVAGAAVGTAILPVIGTAIGARIGAAIGRIFGSSTTGVDKAAPPPKAAVEKPVR